MLKKKTTLTVFVGGDKIAEIGINGRHNTPQEVDRAVEKEIALYREMNSEIEKEDGAEYTITFETMSYWWEE